ncbi:unnamed protein product [Menidia menidia]|uniref:(Atlantic silverside) hypothetical protein n=1 Tax=Menidia menidia TaxID=238744 RepID=A0A8S4BKX5_9TELE|nr:unnamed protein product [Menidia menidia]
MHVMLLSSCVLVWLMPGPGFPAPTSAPEEKSSPSPEPQVDLDLATDYLRRYYNLQRDHMKQNRLSFISKVKDMQSFFGLNATGLLDSETLKLMRSPRCGVPDVEESSRIQGTRWAKSVITYSVSRYTRDLPRSVVDSSIESAVGVWAGVSGLTFVRSNTRTADITVDFVTHAHGDLYPFDGPGGALAHAFGPGLGAGGDMHFDDDEHWTAGETGSNLFVVAAHEFGHALGLKHSRNPESIMYPNYRSSPPANLLSTQDVADVNALYSPLSGHSDYALRSTKHNPWLPNQLSHRLLPDKCGPDMTFDAITTLGDSTVFFRDRYLWIKHNVQSDIKEGPITNFMPKIETRVDAAFWVPRRSTAYLIHESMFWTVKGSLVKGKPRALTHFGFPAWVQDVDAAVHIVKTGRTLFFMHDIYWSYNENRKVMDSGYPKYIIERFPGVNSTIDAAFHKENFIYFFLGPQVYKFDLTRKLVDYLQRFHSLKLIDRNSRGLGRRTRSVPATEEKLREIQNFGLKESESLADFMREPRCGVPDVENFSFYPLKPKWKNHTITYKIAKYTPDMRREDVESSLHAALKMWSDAAPLSFIRVNQGKADIVFTFARGMHGDFFPFDGPQGVLAHAFQPGEGLGGDVHFDEDETWTAGRQGYSLFAVAAHELGHSLGLTHSKDPSAIMYPTYKYRSSAPYALATDDVLGIQMLYGKPKDKLGTLPTAPKKCHPHFSFDAAALIQNEITFFKNRRMWLRTTKSSYWNRLREAPISAYLPSVNSPVDAAYDIPAKGMAYIFSGPKYWVVQRLRTRSRSDSIYEYGFPSSVRQIDAAVHVHEHGKTMFFVGEVYYRYDENNKQMDPGFPRLIQTDWRGLPRRIDAAFKLHGSIFLLSGSKSYQFDFRKKQVVKVIPGNSWLGC